MKMKSNTMQVILRTIFLFLMFLPMVMQAANYALIIGVGNYPKDSGWWKIHGDKDLELIEPILLNHGFEKSNIIKLVNEQATRLAIEKSFNKLISKAKVEDVIYIHFSGHGQQITDLNGDEEDGLDEAWIPYDAKLQYSKGEYEGENHIIDDMLNTWLFNLRKKVGEKGKIIVVVDACFSGDGTRSFDDDIIVRGTSYIFNIPGTHEQYTPDKSNKVDWIAIFACESKSASYETQEGHGSLTYAMCNIADKLSVEPCYVIRDSLECKINNQILRYQKPVLTAEPSNRRNDTILP